MRRTTLWGAIVRVVLVLVEQALSPTRAEDLGQRLVPRQDAQGQPDPRERTAEFGVRCGRSVYAHNCTTNV
jgi:hypothetical protein